MNSSGIKRGLAATAVGALAVTGLPFLASTASAQPASAQAPSNGVALVAPATSNASPMNDGQNNTIRLEAIADTEVSNITFMYQIGANNYQKIATVSRNDDGAFSYEWANAIVGTDPVILAISTDANGQPVDINGNGLGTGAFDDPAADFTGAVYDDGTVSIDYVDTVNVNDGSNLGVFQSPYGGGEQYVAVTGTTSEVTGDVTVSSDTATDVVAPVQVATGATTGTFAARLDIASANGGYVYSVNGGADELGVSATTDHATTPTDDAEYFTLYRQTIATVTATTSNAGPSGADVKVTVTDQNGKPIAGAQVVASSGLTVGSAPVDNTTDANGQVKFGSVSGSGYFYADATATPGYQANLGDQRSTDLNLDQYVPVPTTLAAGSHDGAAFDVDEYAAGDITVKVKDQNGNAVAQAGRTVSYYWVETPFDGAPAGQRFPATGTVTATTNGSGVAAVDFPTSATGAATFGSTPTDANGTWVLHASLTADPATGTGGIGETSALTVKAGQANIVFDQSPQASAPAGTSVDVTGDLELPDHTTLPNRTIAFNYAGGGTDAGIVQTGGGTAANRTIKLGADGKFSLTIKDKVTTPTQATENGTLTGTTQDSDFVGDGGNDGNANDTSTLDVVFAQATPPAGAKVTISAITNATDATPGVAETGTVKITEADGTTAVANQVVTLTVDGKSFFTSGADKSTAKDMLVGDLTDLGQSIQLVTNGSGEATFKVAIGRSAEFDDDGFAEDIVTATAGTVSDTEDVDYSSEDPLNGSKVDLEFAPASEQENSSLPKAQPGTQVAFDVMAFDQFGNPVAGETVDLSDNTGRADIVKSDGTAITSVTTKFDDVPDFWTTSDSEIDQVVTATWAAPVNVYNASGTPAAATTKNLTDSQTVEWGQIVITDASVSMTRTPAGTVPVGTAVTETVTVLDEDGNPVPGVTVSFSQAGPGSVNSTNNQRVTNSSGQAFYTFLGAEEGSAFVSAVIETGGVPVTKTDTVTFGKVGPVYAQMKMQGIDKGKRDVIKVDAVDAASGATVKLFKRKADGSLKQMKTAVLNGAGNFTFRVHDGNGTKATRYTVKLVGNDAVRPAVKSRKVK